MQPREKLTQQGASSLSEIELVAILLRTGKQGLPVVAAAEKLLQDSGGLVSLSTMSPQQIATYQSMGLAKATTLCAAFELARRAAGARLRTSSVVSATQACTYFLERLGTLDVEEVHCLFLNNRKGLIVAECLSQGGATSASLDPKLLIRRALMVDAASFIVAHNHPSGDPIASSQDISITRAIVNAGAVVGIHCDDHIIVGADQALSIRNHHPQVFT